MRDTDTMTDGSAWRDLDLLVEEAIEAMQAPREDAPASPHANGEQADDDPEEARYVRLCAVLREADDANALLARLSAEFAPTESVDDQPAQPPGEDDGDV